MARISRLDIWRVRPRLTLLHRAEFGLGVTFASELLAVSYPRLEILSRAGIRSSRRGGVGWEGAGMSRMTMGVAVAIGAGVGAAIGVATESLAVWLAVGVAIGGIVGLGAARRDR